MAMLNYAGEVGEAGNAREGKNDLIKICWDAGTVNCHTKWDRRPSGLYTCHLGTC